MPEVITAVYEITADDPAARAGLVAVEQSHELPTELAPANAVRDSLAHVRSVVPRAGRPALATVEYPVDLAGGEIGQLLVLLLGNVSLQDGVRLVEVDLPPSLTARLPGPRLGIAGVRALAGEPERALLATALKPVGMTSEQLAGLAYELAAGGLHVIKEDQGLADQPWAPFAERVPRIADAARRPLHGMRPALPTPGGGMTIARAPELLDAYGPDTLFLVGGDLRRGDDPRAAAERLVAATR
ncbi:RuBisCO large subunit C-terminal-like domain-containing protein [Dactylosporangium sp. NPDC049140]|uniref:RuBisCO large subunit C-terminal-like domain-containing protein n=1 Tax=Dactylosporangium sp. NPDC049140 TaxID=3155647 RepID=UPI00340D8467